MKKVEEKSDVGCDTRKWRELRAGLTPCLRAPGSVVAEISSAGGFQARGTTPCPQREPAMVSRPSLTARAALRAVRRGDLSPTMSQPNLEHGTHSGPPTACQHTASPHPSLFIFLQTLTLFQRWNGHRFPLEVLILQPAAAHSAKGGKHAAIITVSQVKTTLLQSRSAEIYTQVISTSL